MLAASRWHSAAPQARANRAYRLPVVNPGKPEGPRAVSLLLPGPVPQLLRAPDLRRLASAEGGGRPRVRVARFAASPVRAVGRKDRAAAEGAGAAAAADVKTSTRSLDLSYEAQDAWEEEQDEAWHPDDAAEARRPRQAKAEALRPQPRPGTGTRTRPVAVPRPPVARGPAPCARPAARQFVLKRQAGYHEQRLQFTPFEHPDTCRFISTLKAKGMDGLLAFRRHGRRAGAGITSSSAKARWARRGPSWFQRRYGLGPLVFTRNLPHLDVAFESENPYASYNWELFFHAPLQVAVRLAKDGRHEEAQRWFHFIFDPTTDSSSPSPKRYWRFAPFYENNEYDNARALMQLLSSTARQSELAEKYRQVRNQLSAWWEKPFSPHVIARLRIAAYQKAVVMKYIDNLVEWGDKLFRRDTMESIQEATQIYILAANILGPRPEKIPPIVSQEPLTFQKMRHDLNLFSNFEVRLENLPGEAAVPNQRAPGNRRRHGGAGDGDAVLLHTAQPATRQVPGTRSRIGSSRSATA